MTAEVCRLCEGYEEVFVNLFEEENELTLKKLRECTDISVKIGDGLPTYICKMCNENIEFVHEFKKQCNDTDRRLRERLKNKKNDEMILEEEGQLSNSKTTTSHGSTITSEDCEFLDDDSIDIFEDIVKTKPHASKRKKQTKIFQCDTCNATFDRVSELNAHKKEHGNKRYQCPTCSKWFSMRYKMNSHMKMHEHQPLPCHLCGKEYTLQGNLTRHIKQIHQNERLFVCSACGLSFSRSDVLNQHMTIHIEERNYICSTCGKGFKSSCSLGIHRRSHVPIEERAKGVKKKYGSSRNYICPTCGKFSASTAALQSHMRTHTGEKPFECTSCDKKFAFYQSLHTHTLTHTGEKPHKCDVCNLTFRQLNHLKGHKLIHTGARPHKCKYCEKSFALRGNLRVHERMHTGEKPYNCTVCEKSFCDSNRLKKHKMTHFKKSQKNEISKIKIECMPAEIIIVDETCNIK